MIGGSLAELAVSAVLCAILAAALAGLLHGHERLARSGTERVADAETVRIAATVLDAELRWLAPAADIQGSGPDSIAIRAFRGFGVTCGNAGSATHARYRGQREPDPAKDSVLVLHVNGLEAVHALGGAARAPGACSARAGEEVYRLELPAPVPRGTPILVFESGSYHLVGRALRYRRGAAGRQPLTPERLDAARSRISLNAGPGRNATLEIDLAAARSPGHGRRPAPRATRFRLPLPNASDHEPITPGARP